MVPIVNILMWINISEQEEVLHSSKWLRPREPETMLMQSNCMQLASPTGEAVLRNAEDDGYSIYIAEDLTDEEKQKAMALLNSDIAYYGKYSE